MKRVAYWVCTGLVVFFIGSGGLAYAGIMFDLTGAASASIATGGAWWHVAAPLSIAVLLAASWALRPESRRLPGATIRGLGMRPS